jgi:transposase-like protein
MATTMETVGKRLDFERDERRRVHAEIANRIKDSGALDEIFRQIDSGSPGDSSDLIGGLLKAALERGLAVELSSHLGYEKGDPDAGKHSNSRNGSSKKTVITEVGDVELSIPRDREGSFTPMLVPKGKRRLDGIDGMIISLYAGGMTVRDIQHHLYQTLGTELSHDTISKITDEILDEVVAWQTRPLDSFYPVMFMDAIRIKIRDGAHVVNRVAHIVIGVDMDGVKHVLGIWVQASEGARFWASVCAELANRGVRDVLVVCCDGLTGFPEAIEATWENVTVQTCVVHLIRAAMRFVGYQDRKIMSSALRPIYSAPNEENALKALDEFRDSEIGMKHPQSVKVFENAWEQFIPFLTFPPELRRVIYTTNAIESLNYQLRKVTKARGHFPNDIAAVKMLWLAICNIEDKRARERQKKQETGGEVNHWAKSKLIEGAATTNWPRALGQLAALYPDRINQHI